METVTHNPGRFHLATEHGKAVLEYRLTDRVIEMVRTFVPPLDRGRGHAERLCKAAFEFAAREKLSVIPACWYISDFYLRRHPEYRPLVKK